MLLIPKLVFAVLSSHGLPDKPGRSAHSDYEWFAVWTWCLTLRLAGSYNLCQRWLSW